MNNKLKNHLKYLIGVIGLVVGFYVWVIKAWVQFPDDPLFLFFYNEY